MSVNHARTGNPSMRTVERRGRVDSARESDPPAFVEAPGPGKRVMRSLGKPGHHGRGFTRAATPEDYRKRRRFARAVAEIKAARAAGLPSLHLADPAASKQWVETGKWPKENAAC